MSANITAIITQLNAAAQAAKDALSSADTKIEAAVKAATDGIGAQAQAYSDLQGKAASLQSQLDLANAHAADLQKQLDAARKPPVVIDPPVTKPPITVNPPAKPTAAIEAAVRLIPGKYVGDAWHVDGTSSDLAGINPIDMQWQWDFGDPGSQYNQLTGFNAAHIYNTPGDYTITLTLTGPDGKASTATQAVHVAVDNRPIIHVASDGSGDAATVADAAKLLKPDTVIAFRRGDKFALDASWTINQPNVRITAYGTGDKPYIAVGTASINLYDTNAIIDGLTLDAADRAAVLAGTGPTALMLRGSNLVIRDCTFPYMWFIANGNGQPAGVLFQGNDCPNADGLDKYFCWVEGSDYTFLDNHVANSVIEHCIRMTRASRINLQYNDLTNLDRRSVAPGDYSKTTIASQITSYIWVANNKLTDGPLEFGPLSNKGQATDANRGDRCTYAVAMDNTITNTFVSVGPGSQSVRIEGNHSDIHSGFAYTVAGYSDEYQRGVENLKIVGNTVTSDGQYGGFVKYDGPAKELVLNGNTFVDPGFITGAGQSANVYVGMNDLSAFTSIRNNTWQKPIKNTWTKDNAAFYVWPGWSNRAGYWTIEKWLAQPQVSGDKFREEDK